jgi:hypothetical protein
VAVSDAGYVGSEACAACHQPIYDSYRKTSMGQSMSPITPALIGKMAVPATFYDARQDRHYDIYAKDGALYQSEYQKDATGREVFRTIGRLSWIVGSGSNIRGGIVERSGYLFEAPMALYTATGKWSWAPGYASADYSFSRPVLAGCIVCHSGRAHAVEGTNGEYDKKVFSEISIGCENCHGPGRAHIEAMSGGECRSAPGEDCIVNPAMLKPELANNLCMGCHQIGDERVLQPYKSYSDLRPGEPLGKTLAIFMVPPRKESPPDSDHLQHVYSMMLSRCYRASGGRLRCISCHDPHIRVTAQEAPAFYRERCLTCHTEQSCGLPMAARRKQNPSDNCIGCHMQRRPVAFMAHTSLTNHRILATPDEALPSSMFHATTAALPDLINLDPVPGEESKEPPLLTLLTAYGELSAFRPEYREPYLRVLDRLEISQPENPLVEAAVGRRDLAQGRIEQAIDHLERAINRGATAATACADLSAAFERHGDADAALHAQQQAVRLDPWNPLLQKALIALLIRQKRYADASAALDRYMAAFPQDSFMRQLQAKATAVSAAP